MFDKIFNLLFEKKKSTSCLTVVKKREMKTMPLFYLKNQKDKQAQKTCLSEYFSDRKGLFANSPRNVNNEVFRVNTRR